jgi:hypothetical protein
LEYYNIVRSNAVGEQRCDCEQRMWLQHRKRESEPALKDGCFFTGATKETNGIKLIENVMKGVRRKRSCVHPGYLRKPPDDIYCSALKL